MFAQRAVRQLEALTACRPNATPISGGTDAKARVYRPSRYSEADPSGWARGRKSNPALTGYCCTDWGTARPTRYYEITKRWSSDPFSIQ